MKYKEIHGVVLSIEKKPTTYRIYSQEQSSYKYGPGGRLSPSKFSLIIIIIDSNGTKCHINMQGYKIYGKIEVGDEIFIKKGKKSDHFLNCKRLFNKSDGGKAVYIK